MSTENRDLGEPREPDKIDLVQAQVDYRLQEEYGLFEGALAKLDENPDRQQIRELGIRYMRIAYGRGVRDRSHDPMLVSKIYQAVNDSIRESQQ